MSETDKEIESQLGRGIGKRLLIVDDDRPFRERLAKALERQGFVVTAVEKVSEGIAMARLQMPKFAVLDLRLQDGSGLDVVPVIREADPNSRIVILTGYGNIATAVAAVKAGAVDYLAKPADADQVAAALLTQGADLPHPQKTQCRLIV